MLAPMDSQHLPSCRTHRSFTTPLLGFGLMRLPQKGGRIDREAARGMVELALESGFNYFDTAYMYHGGESEEFAGEALSAHPRDSYLLTTKMPVGMVETEADVERVFEEQLRRTRAGHFDVYLMHALGASAWEKAKRLRIPEFFRRKKEQGLIRRMGFSFHDTPEALQKIVLEFEWEIVQIQLNYEDWDAGRAGEQYAVLEKAGLPVLIMEPLKGGALANLTVEARDILRAASPEADIASWGLRFAASLPNVQTVLSGMSSLEQMQANIRTFSPLRPLDDAERAALARAVEAYRRAGSVPCTGCRYCMPCPAGVDIPGNIALMNRLRTAETPEAEVRAAYADRPDGVKAASCVSCRACLPKCPQKLQIPVLMRAVAKTFA